MPDTAETARLHKALFAELVLMFSSSAMQQLGKLMNPMTGKTEVSLEAAQTSIDLLEMLRAKTAGNLDREEARLLNDTLATLQMNYVETAQAEAQKKPQPAAEPPAAEAKPESAAPAPEGEPKPPADDVEKKDPRFHKTYG
jgi:hypothetical protein